MILLNKSKNSEYIYCTPLEMAVLPYQGYTSVAYYFIKFISRQTNDEVRILFLNNFSPTDRYQKFHINTLEAFGNKKEGFWEYYIKPWYEELAQNDNYPIDIYGFEDINTPICETGLMYLSSDSNFTPTKYEEQSNQYKAYTK